MADRRIVLAAGLVAAAGGARAEGGPVVVSGRVERLAAFPSRHVEARHVDVWLPPGYDGRRPHAVLYMHDGQMLFDPATTWNHQAWRVDEALARGIAAGRLRDCIVVGIWNYGAHRRAEYFPQAVLARLPPPLRQDFVDRALVGRPQGDDYVRFLAEELKPAIDRRFATRPEPAHTLLMGSSMGGLISLYALLQQPQVFGAAAALSTHWIGTFERNTEIPDAMLAWLAEALPPPGRLKLYLDRGTVDLDAQYDDAQARVDALLRERGHRAPLVVSCVFDGADHSENAWQRRLDVPLAFLLG